MATAILVAAVSAAGSDIDHDETVVFFPTCASYDPGADRWSVPIHAWVFEPETDSVMREATLKLFQKSLGLSGMSRDLFHERASAFLVDNERGQDLEIRLGERVYDLGESKPNGHLETELTVAPGNLPAEAHRPPDEDPWVTFELLLPPDDDRRMQGRVQLVRPTGLSVISDIDDTIKVSEVADKSALLRNTFLDSYRPVAGMAAVYDRLAKRGAVFHYVSSSPWQLFEPLDAMLTRDGFPRGSMRLKQFRWKDESFFDLFASPDETKMPVLEAIIDRFAGRQFILIGDAGERDPEIYGELARRHPEQIRLVCIRLPSPSDRDEERFAQAFGDVDPSRWTVFTESRELADAIEQRLGPPYHP